MYTAHNSMDGAGLNASVTMVWHRSSNQEVTGSTPARAVLAQQP